MSAVHAHEPWAASSIANGAEELWRRKYDAIPLALYEEDYSQVADAIADLRSNGVTDLTRYLTENRPELDRLIGLIVVKAVNRQALTLVGAESETQLLGTLPADIFDEQTHRSFICQFEAIWNGKQSVAVELEGQQFGGEHIDCLMTWAVPADEHGPDYTSVQVAFLDITARRQAELVAKQNAARLTQLYEIGAVISSSLDTASVLEMIVEGAVGLVSADKCAVFLVDHDERVINHRVAVGITDEELADHTYEELENGLAGYVWESGVGTSTANTQAEPRNVGPAAQRASETGPMSIVIAPLMSADGVIGTLAALRTGDREPLSEDDHLYIEMLASLASIALTNASLYSGLKETMDALGQTQATLLQAQKLEAVGQLAAGVAHEINTPIQFISDNLAFMRDTIEDVHGVLGAGATVAEAAKAAGVEEEVAAYEKVLEDTDFEYLHDEIPTAIHQSLDGVQRVAAIVRALKEFSHPGGDSLAPVDINRAIENTLTVARNEWKYVAEAVTEFDDLVGSVPALSGPLNQVFLNLLVNAAHAIHDVVGETGELGTITLSTKRVEPWIEIRITDTGIGIPDEVKQRIFDPFFTTKEVGKGTGQGLAIARDVIVGKHHGELEVESAPGEGTTFIIRIPTEAPDSEETS